MSESEPLRRARALAAQIAACADRIEAERRLPEPLLGALIDAGLGTALVARVRRR